MSYKMQYRNLSFAYRGSHRLALENIDFCMDEGEFVAVVGATGAGKSTFVRCASGIVPRFFKGRYSGDVLLDGESIKGKKVADLAGRVGTVFQDFESQLFCTNARLECAFGMENLGVDRATMKARIDRVAKVCGVAHLLDREPQSLSGGQKQRLALASVLCLDPDILICDEPTTDLDPKGKRDLFFVLNRLLEEKHSIVLVEHETDRLLGADRVLVLNCGRAVGEGRPETLFSDPAFCSENGVRMPQLYEIFSRLGLTERPATVDEAVRILQDKGLRGRLEARVESPAGSSAAPLVRIDDLHFSYIPGAPVLKGVSLEIQQGEFVAILGANGSGKTTLAKQMNGLLTPQSGQALFAGKPVSSIGVARIGQKVGFVFQNPDHMLFAANVFEEVAFGLRNAGFSEEVVPKKVGEALDAVGLIGRDRMDPFILTKGERQKLAVACVLACEPEVLILDEPTTGLDIDDQERMSALLLRLNRAGHTVVMITHSMELAARCARRIVLVHDGRILADGSPRAVFGRPELLAEASLEAPICTRIGRRLGLSVLSVDELVSTLMGGSG